MGVVVNSTDNLPERLRHEAWECEIAAPEQSLLVSEAADEIERLVAALHACEQQASDQREQIERLRAENNNLRCDVAYLQGFKDEIEKSWAKIAGGLS